MRAAPQSWPLRPPWAAGLAAALAVLLAGAAPGAAAAEPDRAHALAFEPAPVGFEVMGVLALAAAAFTAPIDTGSCRWCDPPAFDTAARAALRAPDTELAADFSDALAWGVIPVGATVAISLPPLLGDSADRLDAAENFVIVADTLVLTLALTELAKRGAARERPGVHFDSGVPISRGERNLSFWSGHTAVTFSLAASVATVSFLRGYDSAPWVAAGGGALAATTGLLRVAADRHWTSDVLVGMAVGTGVGVALPLLLHPRRGPAAADEEGRGPRLTWRLALAPGAAGEPPALVATGRW